MQKNARSGSRRKATFKSNVTNENMVGFINLEVGENKTAYMPINGFTTVDIGCEQNNSYNYVNKFEAPFSNEYIRLFDSNMGTIKKNYKM